VTLVVSIAQPCSAPAQTTKPSAKTGPLASASQHEPLAPVASLRQAAHFLDQTALDWTNKHRCGTCHTNYPYLLARGALKEPESAASVAVRLFFEDRVAHWDDENKASKPRWDTEVVATAWALALNDALTTDTLHPLTRKALDRMWTLQKPNGGFDWLKCNWPPLEHDDYYGALVAALGAGYAPGNYKDTPAAKSGVAKFRSFFEANPPPDLHHATVLLWASTRLSGLAASQFRSETIAKLRKLQRGDGGWNLPSLGSWERRDGSSNDPQAPSDGYATGLIVFVLRETGMPADDAAIRRGIGWLLANQRASGRWFTRSLNNDNEHYIARAGTAFAVLALRSCSDGPLFSVSKKRPPTSPGPRLGQSQPSLRQASFESEPPKKARDADSVVDSARLDQSRYVINRH
jgi:squalene-hopene/tetraprenyl-beta-curcumene cyclase